MANQIDPNKAAAIRRTLETLRQQIQEVMPPKDDQASREREPFASLGQVDFYAQEAIFYLGHDQQTHAPPSAWVSPPRAGA